MSAADSSRALINCFLEGDTQRRIPDALYLASLSVENARFLAGELNFEVTDMIDGISSFSPPDLHHSPFWDQNVKSWSLPG